jgi:O-antigen/teichoic acid export membrane protein
MSEIVTDYRPQQPGPAASQAPRRSLPKQVILTAAATFLVAGFTFLTTRFYAQRFDPQDVSSVLLFRLYTSLLVALSVLGMPLSMLRNVAAFSLEPRKATAAAWCGVMMGGGMLALVTILSIAASRRVVEMFHMPGAAGLWIAFAALALVQGIGTLVMYVHFARGHVLWFAALAIGMNGLAQFLPLLLFPHATLVQLVGWAVPLALLALLPGLVEMVLWTLRDGIHLTRAVASRVLSFGLSRMPGSILENTFDPTITWMVVWLGSDLQQAGYLAVGLALLRPFNPIMSSVSSALVPAAARLSAQEDAPAQRRQSQAVAEWSLQVGLFGAALLAVWCDVLIRFWLGDGFRDAAPAARILCLSLLPVFLAGSMRGLIEGRSLRPVNTYNMLVAYPIMLASAAILHGWLPSAFGLALAYLAGRSVLGLLTLRFVLRDQSLRWRDVGLARAALVSSLLVLAAVALRSATPPGAQLLLMLVSGALSTLVFLFAMRRGGAFWARYLLNWRQ